MIAAGLGLRPACDADELVRIVADAAERSGLRPDLLAAPWFRDGAAVRAAAERLGLPLAIIGEQALLSAQPSCSTRSEAALRAIGIASVAEGCALAAAGPGGGLLLHRIATPNATCAIAGPRLLSHPDTPCS